MIDQLESYLLNWMPVTQDTDSKIIIQKTKAPQNSEFWLIRPLIHKHTMGFLQDKKLDAFSQVIDNTSNSNAMPDHEHNSLTYVEQ